MSSIIVQYGLSPSVSLGIAMPFVHSNEMSVKGKILAQNSEMLKRYYHNILENGGFLPNAVQVLLFLSCGLS
jgi:hypothetical protein